MLILSTGLRNAMLGTSGFKTALAAGILYIYDGAQPASADAAVTGTLLAKITVGSGAFAFGSATNGLDFDSPADGVIEKAAAETWSGVGLADGTAGWFRLMGNVSDAGGTSTTLARLDGSVGTSGADLNLGSVAIRTGATVTIDVFQFTLPES